MRLGLDVVPGEPVIAEDHSGSTGRGGFFALVHSVYLPSHAHQNLAPHLHRVERSQPAHPSAEALNHIQTNTVM